MSRWASSRLTIVGLGVMGGIYLRRLRVHGWAEITTVDPRPGTHADFASIEQACAAGPTPDLWIIATPTDTHVQLVRQVLHLDPAARILVEKPVGELSHLRALIDALTSRFPYARVRVSDLYGRGRFADALRQSVRRLPGRLLDVGIEMSKNRRHDELSGRFICRDYGTYGYEWFHVLRLLGVVLPPRSFRQLIEGEATRERYLDRIWRWETDGISVRAASNIDGRVSLPYLGHLGQPAHLGRHQRFRRLRVCTDSARLEAVFDDAREAVIRVVAPHPPDSTACSGVPVPAREITIERSDAVVDSVISLLAEDAVPDPWQSLEAASHLALARLERTQASVLREGNDLAA